MGRVRGEKQGGASGPLHATEEETLGLVLDDSDDTKILVKGNINLAITASGN
jgi:hypothetical protein